MPNVTFIDHSGEARTVEVAPWESLMEAGVNAGVPGLVAECGDACACATCHVYVEAAFLAKVGPADEMGREMLEHSESPVKTTSRLSCQITLNEELEGLTVQTPPAQ